MLPSVDNVFYIFIEVNLYCCLDKHNAINTTFQKYISSQLVLSIKKRIHMNPVLVKWKGHTKHCQNCPGNGRIIASKSNITFQFRWKYMMEQTFCIFPREIAALVRSLVRNSFHQPSLSVIPEIVFFIFLIFSIIPLIIEITLFHRLPGNRIILLSISQIRVIKPDFEADLIFSSCFSADGFPVCGSAVLFLAHDLENSLLHVLQAEMLSSQFLCETLPSA